MIDNYLLEELVAFKKYGTLAAAADQLGLSQPALTRGMKKLETDYVDQSWDIRCRKSGGCSFSK
jgi:DNA-binding transcriptional LysR family regulator